jgi:hypothetical protein
MNTNIHKIVSATAALAVLAFGAVSACADQKVSVQVNMPVHSTLKVDETGCDNSPGPQITIEGELALGGLQVQLLFENNVKGTHQTVVTSSKNVVLLPAGQSIVIPKQPVLGGVGGNPYIWLQFYDNDGNNLCDPIFLGRCVQGLTLQQDLVNSAVAATFISASDCSNNPGPIITFDGDLTLSGLNARLIFSNNVKGTHTALATVNVNILPDGTSIEIPKQPVDGGSGGNPLVFIQFLQGDGSPIGKSIFLGRCVQM